jgi:ferredoxin
VSPAVLAGGITWAADNGANVIVVLVVTGAADSAELRDAVAHAIDRRVVTVAWLRYFPATGSQLTVDWTRCEGHGLGAHILPEVVSLGTNGYPAIVDRPVPDWLSPQAHKAVSMCPALALRLTEGSNR